MRRSIFLSLLAIFIFSFCLSAAAVDEKTETKKTAALLRV